MSDFRGFTLRGEPMSVLSVTEHEVYLAFNSDWHAAAFMEWLHEEGFDAFVAWSEEHRECFK